MLSNGLSPLVTRKWRLCLHMGITMEHIVRFTCRLLPTLAKLVHKLNASTCPAFCK